MINRVLDGFQDDNPISVNLVYVENTYESQYKITPKHAFEY